MAIVLAMSMIACRIPGKSIASNYKNVDQFNFDVAQGPKNYHIEGYLTRSAEQGKRPGLLVLNGGEGNVDRCVQMSQGIAAMGIQVACVSIPGLRQFVRTEPLRGTAVRAGVAQGARHARGTH